jgi:hypothetical protein
MMNESKQELFAVVRVFDRRGPFRPSQTVETGLSREQARERVEAWFLGPATRFVELVFPQESAPPMRKRARGA